MDIEEKTPSETLKDPLSLSLVDYLIGKVAALERRIELLEGKSTTPSENGDEQFKSISSELSALDKKLDKLIVQTANIHGQTEPIEQAESNDYIEDIEDTSSDQNTADIQANTQTAAKKRVAVFIDGENISHSKAEKIMKKSAKQGKIEFARVYGLQDSTGKCWTKESNELNIKSILLAGGTKKNKVDKQMFREMLNDAKREKHADMIIVATNDTDFIPVINEITGKGIQVVVMGVKASLSGKIKNACNSFLYL